MTDQRVAIVTGGNRGLGFETCRQLAKKGLRVVLGSRSGPKGEEAAAALRAEGLDVAPFQVAVTDQASVGRLGEFLAREYGRCDVLVNNAGVLLDPGAPGAKAPAGALEADVATLRDSMETNVYGALRMIQTAVPLMRRQGYGRIVNVSSGMGQLEHMTGGFPGYRTSKAALNALTRIVADELAGTNVLVNAVCPGWVKTDMGGPGATRTPERGVQGIVWAAMLPDGGPTGGFFRDGKPIAW